MKMNSFKTALLILTLFSAPAFSDNREKPAKCNYPDDFSFVQEIAFSRKNLEKYMPKNVFFGTLYERSGSVYEVQHSPKDFSIPFTYFGKGANNQDAWVKPGTATLKYPVFVKVDISHADKGLRVRWQNVEDEIHRTNGIIQQMEFTPRENGCWELRAVYTVEEKL